MRWGKTTRDGYVLMDVVLAFKTPQKNVVDPTKPYRSARQLRAFDCRKRMIGTVQVSLYPDEAAVGEMIVELQEPIPLDKVEFKSASPGTNGSRLIDLACNRISKPSIWFALIKAKLFGGKLELP